MFTAVHHHYSSIGGGTISHPIVVRIPEEVGQSGLQGGVRSRSRLQVVCAIHASVELPQEAEVFREHVRRLRDIDERDTKQTTETTVNTTATLSYTVATNSGGNTVN